MSSVAAFPRPAYAYRTPGVVFEWLDQAREAVPLRTDVAGFVGIAERGPPHVPERVESWTQFVSVFGGHIPQAYLAYAVDGFFANGGATCWVVRVADPATARPASLVLEDDLGNGTLQLTALSPGTWGAQIVVTVERLATDRFALSLRLADGVAERWRDLTMDENDDRYAVRVLGDDLAGSRLVAPADLNSASLEPANTPSEAGATLRYGTGRLGGGADGLAALTTEHFSGASTPPDQPWGLRALETVDEVSILAMPDAMAKPLVVPPPPPPDRVDCTDLDAAPLPPRFPDVPLEWPPAFGAVQVSELQDALVGQATLLGDRFAILDTRPEDVELPAVLGWRDGFDTSYGALYFPWLRVEDPLRLEGLLRAVPPSGHVAGVYARVDNRVGVHKPPANELVEGAVALTADTNDLVHGDLNDAGVDVIRVFNGPGIRVGGARTLSSDRLLQFVNVRRLLMMVERAIEQATAWTVFEPNAPRTWRAIDRIVRGFLDRLWRRGLLDGATAADAYLVRCDETTNPPEARDEGRLTALVGLQPPWPAEFVVVRIGKTDGGTSFEEGVNA